MDKKILIGIGILIVVVFFFRSSLTGNVISNGDVRIPVSEITGQAKFYNEDGIKFFVVRADNGLIKTAFDACDVCYGSYKGYRQEGDSMICNNCGNSYPISGLGTENKGGGGCWPGYLPSEIKGEYLIIKKSDIKKGGYRF